MRRLVVVLLIAAAGAAGWYLGSPLLIRTMLSEPPSSGGASVIASGAFAGADDFHFGRGTASIVTTATRGHELRFEDFSVRNGPDLYVYLSPAVGWDPAAVELGRLKATDGAFAYELPPGTDPASFRSAIVWCRAFTTLFATAELRAVDSAS